MENKRQAFIILSHGGWNQLHMLIGCLQDEAFDIYLHLDADVDGDEFLSDAKSRYSNLYVLERMSCYWGTVSLVKVELDAFAAVLSSGREYGHIHLLSGNDMPIKSNDVIKSFFSANEDRNFVLLYPKDAYKCTHVRCHYPFPRCFQRKGMPYLPFKAGRFVNTVYHILEKMLLVHVWNMHDVDLRKGSQWVSITPAFASYMVRNRKRYLRMFSHAFAPDEFLIGTALYESEFSATHVNDNKRFIKWPEWHSEHPFDLTMKHYGEFMASDCLFARKFNCDADMDVVMRIRDSISR